MINLSFIPYASALGQDLANSINKDSQQIVFSLKEWVNIENYNNDNISTLQTIKDFSSFPDTSIIMAIDGNNNMLNDGDDTSSSLLKVDFVGQINLTGSSQIIFECSIDSSTFDICTSPNIIDNLDIGKHSFEVRAIDETGMFDETPAQFTWTIVNETTNSIEDENDDATIDVSPPSTKITNVRDKHDNNLLNQDNTLSTSIRIFFEGSDDTTSLEGLTFECSIDSSTFDICTSPNIIDNLDIGKHSFEVRAIDQVGKIDETPVQFTLTIIDLNKVLNDIEIIIENSDISNILKNNLNVILREIQTLVNQKNPNNDKEICDNLEEFILQITNNNNDISATNSNVLVKNINSIIDNMQC
ncbi:MAG TPA: hypothetical protein VFM31_11190 [Nitrososphaeraceae archaeon]|nr:hypothetical protein [Nitrososphaeraceae archaeon]